MTSPPLSHAVPPTRKLAGVASLIFGILAATPLGLFLAAEVGLAESHTVEENLAWGTAAIMIGTVAIYGGTLAALLAIGVGFVALVRNGRIGKGCGLAGMLLGGVVLVWLALAVLPHVGGF